MARRPRVIPKTVTAARSRRYRYGVLDNVETARPAARETKAHDTDRDRDPIDKESKEPVGKIVDPVEIEGHARLRGMQGNSGALIAFRPRLDSGCIG